MAYTLTLTAGENSITVNRPRYGYECEIHMAIQTAQACDGSYDFWDNGLEYDYRLLSLSQFLFNTTHKTSIAEFFRNAAKGRAENVVMSLGDKPTGFYPFGPDYGDVGDFTVRVMERIQSGILYTPYKWFEENIVLQLVPNTTLPSYTFQQLIKQGKLKIGDIDGLRWVQFKPKTMYSLKSVKTRNGIPYTLDNGLSGDSWETDFELELNYSNAAAIVNYLTKMRDFEIDIITQNNYFSFGMDQLSSGTYSTKQLGTYYDSKEIILNIKHVGFNQFVLPLSFYMKEKIA